MSNQPEPWIKDGARATVISTGREVTLVGEPWQDYPTKEWCIDIDKKGFCVHCDDIKPAHPTSDERLARIVGMVESFQAEHTNVDAMDEYVASGELLSQIKSIAKGEANEPA